MILKKYDKRIDSSEYIQLDPSGPYSHPTDDSIVTAAAVEVLQKQRIQHTIISRTHYISILFMNVTTLKMRKQQIFGGLAQLDPPCY